MSSNNPSGGNDLGIAPESATVSDLAFPLAPWTRIIVVVAAIAAGLASWGVVEGVLNAYGSAFLSKTAPYPTAEDSARIVRARVESGTITFAATGGMLGLALGLAGGSSRRSISSAMLAGFLGLVVGGLAEGGLAYGALRFIYTKIDVQSEDLLQAMLCHGTLWAVVGLAGGLAFGIGAGGRGGWWKGMFGGLVGVVLATVVYELAGALVFPTDGTQQPYADSALPRALAQVLMPLGVALGALVATSQRSKRPAST